MYYFGTNLDNKFSVPGFWPSKEQSNRVPRERKELDEELERLKTIRLNLRNKRLEEEASERGDWDTVRQLRADAENTRNGSPAIPRNIQSRGREG
jgi:protein PET100, fungi type